MNEKHLYLTLNYSQGGGIIKTGSRRITETKMLSFDALYFDEETAGFKKALKDALQVFKKEKAYNAELILEYGRTFSDTRRFALVSDNRFYETETVKLYVYSLDVYETDINDMSLNATYKALCNRIDDVIEKYNV